MKRKLRRLLAAVLLIACALTAQAHAGYENFTMQQAYPQGQFADVPDSAWYAENVRTAYEYGLINGQSESRFAPDSSLTVAEAVKLAASLHQIYTAGSAEFAASSPWYRTYADYALEHGILSAEAPQYRAAATRAEFAVILAAALPAEALPVINEVEPDAIPDVPMDARWADAVYLLYRAGVLTGADREGRFRPNSTIARSEAAAIVTRMADPSLRQRFELRRLTQLTQVEIYQNCLPAVFKLYAYGTDGSLLAMGSGTLISADGDAVTCGHILNGVHGLAAELADGTRLAVGIYDMDVGADIAYIHLYGSGLPYMRTSTEAKRGDGVYTLGYPGGGAARMTAGRILDPASQRTRRTMIETSAMIISGNSGGALVDCYGRLIGVTVSSASSGIPSYSVPISALDGLDHSQLVDAASYTAAHRPDASFCYGGLYPVPDFGKVTGVPLYASSRSSTDYYYYYRLADFPGAGAEVMYQYYTALNENTFYLFSGGTYTSSAGYRYAVQLYETSYYGDAVIGVIVSALHSSPVGGLPWAEDPLSGGQEGRLPPVYGSLIGSAAA